MIPHLLYANNNGRLFEDPNFLMAVFDGTQVRAPREDEIIELPEGSDVFFLPGRRPYAINPVTMGPEVLIHHLSASAFISPAYLRTLLPAYEREDDAPVLPLYAYAPVGSLDGRFYTTAIRIDPSERQNPLRFDLRRVRKMVRRMERRLPDNALVRHLEHCALVYKCRAAQNFFLRREEAPLPTSPSCNARCIGCLSEQKDSEFSASHDRIQFVPSAGDIAQVALTHFEHVENPVASFGQGCEGEPLLQADRLAEAIRLIRAQTLRGTININTNASRPKAVEKLCKAGLDSMRMTMNCADKRLFDRYFRGTDYSIENVKASGKILKDYGGFLSVNLLVFPGLTDREDQVEKMIDFLGDTGVDMVQWRNLNLDPDIYMDALGRENFGHGMGIAETVRRVKNVLPTLKFGYFNPYVGSRAGTNL